MVIIIIMHLVLHSVNAQNLILNPGFEETISCPPTYGLICMDWAPPWECGNLGSADLYNRCAIPGQMGVPENTQGYQQAHTDDGYAGILTKWLINWREYLLIPIDPLTPGAWYHLSFYVSLGDDAGCGIEKLGGYFSPTSPYVGTWAPLNVTPQVESDYGFLDDMEGWTLVNGCFQAEGGESFLTIGNFHDDAETPLDPDCDGSYSYYYIDDVTVVEGSAPELHNIDLGGPITACFTYEIDPESAGPYFIWNDGSNEPTLTVTESGTYSLTITDGCNIEVGVIEVEIILPTAPVDLGPDVLLCDGETHTISIDPNLGDVVWNTGSTESTFIVSGSGVYSVTVDDGCSTSTDEITIDALDSPAPFDLGDDSNLCIGSSVDFTFDPTLGDFMWQDGSTGSTFTVMEEGIYTLTISNACGEETDEIEFTSIDIPDIDLGEDDQLLCTGEMIEIELNPDLGEFLWQDGSTFNFYEISEAGTYMVFVTNECGTGSDQIVVSEADLPVFDLGSDQTLCPGESLALDGDSITGNYIWQDGSTATTYTVTSSGSYELTITNACGIGVDMVDIDFVNAVLQPDLGPDINLCPGEKVVLHVADPNASFVWQDGSTLDSFVVLGAGQYYVQAYNVCGAFSDTINVTLNAQPPSVDLPAAITLCQGQAIVLDAGVSGVAYLWNDNSTESSLTVNTAGTYSVTVSNSCGSDFDNVVIADGGPAPVVELGNDVALCPGDTIVLSPTFDDVDSWLWSSGETIDSIAITSASITSVIVSNGCGTAYDTLHSVLLPAIPSFSLGNDTAVCAGQQVLLSISVPDVGITWSDGSQFPQFTALVSGQYFASITNTCGAFADTILINQLPAVPAVDLGNDQSLCPGELIVIDPGVVDVEYLWNDGSTATTYSTTQADTIVLSISNSCGISTDTVFVFESTQGPEVDLGADITGCGGESVTINAGISGVDYVWQDGSTGSSFVVDQSGEIILNVFNNCGSDADTIQVDLSGVAPAVDLGADTILCDGESLLLEVNALPAIEIVWQDGSTLQTFVAAAAGIYFVQLTSECGFVIDSIEIEYENTPAAFSIGADTTICDGEQLVLDVNAAPGISISWTGGTVQPTLTVTAAGTYAATLTNHCGQSIDDINVDVEFVPALFDLGPDVVLCPGDSIVLNAPVTGDQLRWQNGATTSSIVANQEQAYSLQVSNQCGSATDEMDLTFDQLVPVIQLDPALKLCPPESIELDVTQTFNAMYSWSTGENTSSIEISSPGTYVVTVSSDCATASHEVDVTINEACAPKTHFYIPNVFSPNGDGLNDVFEIQFNSTAKIESISGQIFDRWGNMVFASTGIPFIWNGKRNDESLNPGVYVYRITLQYVKGLSVVTETLTGDVTIIH